VVRCASMHRLTVVVLVWGAGPLVVPLTVILVYIARWSSGPVANDLKTLTAWVAVDALVPAVASNNNAPVVTEAPLALVAIAAITVLAGVNCRTNRAPGVTVVQIGIGVNRVVAVPPRAATRANTVIRPRTSQVD